MSTPFSGELVQRLSSARRLAVLTGAGISAESGIPTFRDKDGLWDRFKPEELASVRAFLRNPELVQKWYEQRRRVAFQTQPNAGHRALAELEDVVEDFTLVTQNVDDLHHRAGSQRVVELHGNITRSYCIDCEQPAEEEVMRPIAEGRRAVCPSCGGLIRPDVVWFGELLPEGAMEAAYAAAERADVFLSVGTSAVVYPAAGIPLQAKAAGAYVVEINIEPSAIAEEVDEVVLGRAGEVLPALVDSVKRNKNSG